MGKEQVQVQVYTVVGQEQVRVLGMVVEQEQGMVEVQERVCTVVQMKENNVQSFVLRYIQRVRCERK